MEVLPNICRRIWLQTGPEKIYEAQTELLQNLVSTTLYPRQIPTSVRLPFCKKSQPVTLSTVDTEIDPIGLNKQSGDTLVLAHGLGSGLGFWFDNYDFLAKHFKRVISVDWLGFGGSSRPGILAAPRIRKDCRLLHFNACSFDAAAEGKGNSNSRALDFFVDSLAEALQSKELGLNGERVVLVGHSLGGYLSAMFTIKYPDLVKSLGLCSPAGLISRPLPINIKKQEELPVSLRLMDFAWHSNVTPGQIIRLMGPRAKKLVENIVKRRFHNRWDARQTNLISNYLYHITAARGSGEYAMNSLLEPISTSDGRINVYAKEPISDKLRTIPSRIKVRVQYGDNDWLYQPECDETVRRLQAEGVDIGLNIIPSSGHHLYLDNPDAFHRDLQRLTSI
eukprot:m.127204 g.127204  ORF g.127204 m.127204 type:complete len:393 (+) comp14540_c0_seq2:77-1255(+)